MLDYGFLVRHVQPLKSERVFRLAKQQGSSAADWKNFRIAARNASELVKRDHWNIVDEIASGRKAKKIILEFS